MSVLSSSWISRRHLLFSLGTMLPTALALRGALRHDVPPAFAGALTDSLPEGQAAGQGTSAPPPAAYIPGDANIEGYRQKWALSCEFAATHTALRLLGIQVEEEQMRPLLGSGEDPDVTFRGEIQANQDLDDYGVHAKGIAHLIELLKGQRLLPADIETHLLHDLDAVRLALSQGQPVVAWIPLDLRPSQRVAVTLSTGKVVHLVYAEHAITLRGYDQDRFLALDPHSGDIPAYAPDALWRGMNLFDDPALAIGYRPVPTPTPVPDREHFAATGITLEGGFYRAYQQLGGGEQLGLPLTQELHEETGDGQGRQVIYTEAARLEWSPATGAFTLGPIGTDYLGDGAHPDPQRKLSGAIGRHFDTHGGLGHFGPSLSEQVPIDPASGLLPQGVPGASDAIGQWFQNGLLVWTRQHGITFGLAGKVLAQQRGLVQ